MLTVRWDGYCSSDEPQNVTLKYIRIAPEPKAQKSSIKIFEKTWGYKIHPSYRN